MRNFIFLSLFAALFIGTFHLAAQTPPTGFGNPIVVNKEEVESINPELAGAETILSELEAELKELRKDTSGMVPEAAVQRAVELDAKIQSQRLLIDYLKALPNSYAAPRKPVTGLAVTLVPKGNPVNTSKAKPLGSVPLVSALLGSVSLNNSPEKARIIVDDINQKLDSTGSGNLIVVSKEGVKSINPELAGAETILSKWEAELNELRKKTLEMVPEATVQRALELNGKIQSQKLLIDYLKTLPNKPNQICYVAPCEPIQEPSVTFVAGAIANVPERVSVNTSKSDLPPKPLIPVLLNNSPEKVRIIVDKINEQLDSLDERRNGWEQELAAPIEEFPCSEESKNNRGEAVMAALLKVKIALLQNEVSYLEAITAGEDKIPFAMTQSVLLSFPPEDIKTMTNSNNGGECAEEIYGIVRRVINDKILVLQKEIEMLESVKKIYEAGVSR